MALSSQPSARPRPTLAGHHAASAPEPAQLHAKPLPTRPANSLQQQHYARHGKSYDSSTRLQHRPQVPESVPHVTNHSLTGCQTQPRPYHTSTSRRDAASNASVEQHSSSQSATRPVLTSKFSFDNLAELDQGADSAARAALKKMVTRAWLHNITSAARDSIHSLSSSASSSSSPSDITSPHVSPLSSRARTKSNDNSEANSSNGSSKTTRQPLIISNPQLVHAGGTRSVNTRLGSGAQRIGSIYELQHPSDSIPQGRRSQDSTRSAESAISSASTPSLASQGSTSACSNISSTAPATYHSGPLLSSSFSSERSGGFSSRSRQHDRALPYLPLRLRHAPRDGKDDKLLQDEDAFDVEQLVLTPALPAESTRYILRNMQEQDESDERDRQRTQSAQDVRRPADDLIRPARLIRPRYSSSISAAASLPGGSAASSSNNRPRADSASSSKDDVTSIQAETWHKDGNLAANIQASSSHDLHMKDPSASEPFIAMALQPVPIYPQTADDSDKLVNLHIGGSRIFTTTLQVINRHKDSKLARFISSELAKAAQKAAETACSAVRKHKEPDPSHANTEYAESLIDAPEDVRLSKRTTEPHWTLHTAKSSKVELHLPQSPLEALKSARASFCEDVPSDEGEWEDPTDELLRSDDVDMPRSFRQLLDVPLPRFPNPRSTKLRFSRMPPGVETIIQRQASGASSEYSSNADAEDNCLNNFIDTTPDDEAEDPFHFQQQASPLPRLRAGDAPAAMHCGRNTSPPEKSTRSACSPTSLRSCSPGNDSPIRFKSQEPDLRATDPFQQLLAAQEQSMLKPLNIYLDRSAESYDAIMHYLRTTQLPRKLQSQSTIAFDGAMGSDQNLLELVEGLPSDLKAKLLPLLFNPVISDLRDLREEATFLGLDDLAGLCVRELDQLRAVMADTPRNAAAHPVIADRVQQDDQMAERTFSPTTGRRLNGQRPRPRFVGHRQISSESMVLPKSLARRGRTQSQDDWI